MGKIKNSVMNFKGGIVGRLYHDLQWIYTFFYKYLSRVFLYVALESIHMVVDFCITFNLGNIVDYALAGDLEKMLKMALFYIGMFIGNAVLSISVGRCAAWNYNDMQSHLVKSLYYKIVHADWEELTGFHSGDLITRLSNDARIISTNATVFLTTIITNSIMIIVCISVILINDASMILVVAVVAPIILLASRIFMNRIYGCQSEIRKIESREISYDKESFHNIQAVKAFGLADEFFRRIELLEKERYAADMRSNLFSLLSWAVTYLSGIISGIICIMWAFYRVNAGAMTLGGLTVVIAMASRIAFAAKVILNQIPVSLQLAVSTERVCEILDMQDEAETSFKSCDKLMESAGDGGIAVHVKNISFAYKNGRQIFDNVSLEVHPGEIIALVGPSGEGKTTFLRILLGIIKISEGEAFACAENSQADRLDFSTDTRPLIAYVPQGNTILSGTIRDNMKLIATDATDEEIIDALEQSCAYDFVKKLPDGINHNIGEGGIGFSEGQNQRLAIARAILRKTPILLMDEATSALDVATERKVLSNIMKKDARRTCILTTHRPSVLSACDRVYRISDGQIKAIGEEEIQKLMNEF